MLSVRRGIFFSTLTTICVYMHFDLSFFVIYGYPFEVIDNITLVDPVGDTLNFISLFDLTQMSSDRGYERS